MASALNTSKVIRVTNLVNMLRTFIGKFKLKRSVYTMTWRAFTSPHSSCKLPAKKIDITKFDAIRAYIPESIEVPDDSVSI